MSSEDQENSHGDVPANGESDSKETQEESKKVDKRSEEGTDDGNGKDEVTDEKSAPEGAQKDGEGDEDAVVGGVQVEEYVSEALESEGKALAQEIIEVAAEGEALEIEGQVLFQEIIEGAAVAPEESSEESEIGDDIELSQISSGSEDEELAQSRKIALQRMQDVMTKPSDIQDPNHPRVTKDDDKEHMDEHLRTSRDKAILQSMAVAERGYITRLRPPSVPTDKLTLSQYQIRPGLEEKFKSVLVKEMIHTVLNDELGGKIYTEEEAKVWSQSIANTVRTKVKEMGFPRYKFVVQCVIGEEHGAGVKIGSRCLWDADTDNYASDTFLNETIFCMTAVYAIYFY